MAKEADAEKLCQNVTPSRSPKGVFKRRDRKITKRAVIAKRGLIRTARANISFLVRICLRIN